MLIRFMGLLARWLYHKREESHRNGVGGNDLESGNWDTIIDVFYITRVILELFSLGISAGRLLISQAKSKLS